MYLVTLHGSLEKKRIVGAETGKHRNPTTNPNRYLVAVQYGSLAAESATGEKTARR